MVEENNVSNIGIRLDHRIFLLVQASSESGVASLILAKKCTEGIYIYIYRCVCVRAGVCVCVRAGVCAEQSNTSHLPATRHNLPDLLKSETIGVRLPCLVSVAAFVRDHAPGDEDTILSGA